MAKYRYAYYVDLMEKGYFGNVMKEDIPAAIGCFTEDSRVTIYHGDNAIRYFYGDPGEGQLPLAAFYDHLLGNYDVHFENFSHYVDVDNERCASHFTVTLAPKSGSAYEETGTLTLNNCNFFKCIDGKIADMIIYYANPTLGSIMGVETSSPTGFPRS